MFAGVRTSPGMPLVPLGADGASATERLPSALAADGTATSFVPGDWWCRVDAREPFWFWDVGVSDTIEATVGPGATGVSADVPG